MLSTHYPQTSRLLPHQNPKNLLTEETQALHWWGSLRRRQAVTPLDQVSRSSHRWPLSLSPSPFSMSIVTFVLFQFFFFAVKIFFLWSTEIVESYSLPSTPCDFWRSSFSGFSPSPRTNQALNYELVPSIQQWLPVSSFSYSTALFRFQKIEKTFISMCLFVYRYCLIWKTSI